MSAAKLTPQQEKFCKHYVLTGKIARAYRKAYDVKPDTTPETVYVSSSRLLADPKIALRIHALKKIADERFAVTVERIAQEFARIAFLDPVSLHDEKGDFLPMEDWPEDARRAIAGIEVTEEIGKDGSVVGYTKKLRYVSKHAALESLAKWKRMLIDRVEIGTPGEFDALDDTQLTAELKANEEMLRVIDKAKKAPKKVKA